MKTYLAVVIAVVLLPLAFAPELNSQTTLELLQLRPCVTGGRLRVSAEGCAFG